MSGAGIYLWLVEGKGVYIGKAKAIRSRLRAYPNNVRRYLNGDPWHGNPAKSYRRIHRALAEAHQQLVPVAVRVLECCDPNIRSERERYWIGFYRQEEARGGLPVLNDT